MTGLLRLRLLFSILTIAVLATTTVFSSSIAGSSKSHCIVTSNSGVGDLTKTELDDIQKVVNEAGRPAHVVG